MVYMLILAKKEQKTAVILLKFEASQLLLLAYNNISAIFEKINKY